MREAVGSTFLFNIMIIFIFFFASFLAIAINYSQAFRIKNQVINLLEQYEGLEDSEQRIADLIKSSGYYRSINCNPDENGEAIRGDDNLEVKGLCIDYQTTGNGDDVYYKVTTFVSFNLPIVGQFFTFPVRGETKVITNPDI